MNPLHNFKYCLTSFLGFCIIFIYKNQTNASNNSVPYTYNYITRPLTRISARGINDNNKNNNNPNNNDNLLQQIISTTNSNRNHNLQVSSAHHQNQPRQLSFPTQKYYYEQSQQFSQPKQEPISQRISYGYNNPHTEIEKCDGYDNLIQDVEFLGFIISIPAFALGLISWLFHIINQIYLFYSTNMISVVERFIDAVTLISPETAEHIFSHEFEDTVTRLALMDWIVLFVGSFPLGNIIIAIDAVALGAALLALVLSSLSVFSKSLSIKFYSVGIDVDQIFEGYGCNGHSKLEYSKDLVWLSKKVIKLPLDFYHSGKYG